jgi:hypothetical protein
MDNHPQTFKKIDQMYDKLSYSEKYGTSIFFFFVLSLVLFLGISYCIVMINLQPIQDDWIHNRCKPYIIPFAGIINTPIGTSAMDYTSQNFQYCMQNIIKDVTGEAVQPITFVVKILNSLANIIKESINAVRNMFNKVRTQIQSVTQEVMGRLGNMMVPLQQIIISMRDLLGKVQGLMTASLYTLLGSYYTLQSLMGAIAQFIIIILIALAAMIAVLWLVPFTWATAASLTVVFIAIAIPMAMILDFMLNSLHVTPDLQIPTIQCFDENTLILMEDGNYKKIVDIQNGEKLVGGNIVNTKIKVDASRSQLYTLGKIIVSDSHLVKHDEKWVRVSQHPLAIKVAFYEKPYLYCLNTSSKMIYVDDFCFSDWDEMVNYKKWEQIYENIPHVHKYLNAGFHENTPIVMKKGNKKKIQSIEIGDLLKNGEKVIGVVEIDGTQVYEHYLIDLGIHGKIEGGGNLCFSDDLDKTKKVKLFKEKRLFHLLTDTKSFYVNQVKFQDYNASVDDFLENE